jgi:hypothetical protein
MSDGFWVDHNSYADVNGGLAGEVSKMDAIMTDLKTTVNQIDNATGGKATSIWIENQQAANNAYEAMKDKLHGHTQRSFMIANLLHEGDNTGARTMT